jgi:hypothetical protein
MGRNNSGRLVSTNASGLKKPSPERGNWARLARYRAMTLKADIVPILAGMQDTWRAIRGSLQLFEFVWEGIMSSVCCTSAMAFIKNPSSGSSFDQMTPPVMAVQDQVGWRPVHSRDSGAASNAFSHSTCLHKNGFQRPARFVHPVRLLIAEMIPEMAMRRSDATDMLRLALTGRSQYGPR